MYMFVITHGVQKVKPADPGRSPPMELLCFLSNAYSQQGVARGMLGASRIFCSNAYSHKGVASGTST